MISEITPSTLSEALAPGSENVAPTVRFKGLSPISVIVGSVVSSISGAVPKRITSEVPTLTFM